MQEHKDSKMSITRQDSGLLKKEDLVSIENVLYEAKSEELVARQFLRVNTNFQPWASEVGYDYYERTGSAKILARGANAKDVPFVGEAGGRVTRKVYDIVTGIRYERSELDAYKAKAAGKGPSVSLDTLRVSAARRYVAEAENRLSFAGDSKLGIKGLLNHDGITSENVVDSGTGSGASKRLWANKTSTQIVDDLVKGIAAVEEGNIFKARTLLIPSSAKARLSKNFSDATPMTIMRWLKEEGVYFEKVIITNALKATVNTYNTDAFMILDNDPEIVELAVVEEMAMLDPVYDILGNSEMAVVERCAGAFLRHPKAVYVGQGI